MKKIMVITLLLLLSGCKVTDNSVPLIIYDRNDTYMTDFESRILTKANGTVDYSVFDSQNSQVIQNEIIEQQLAKNAKLLIINPVDRLGAYTIIEKAKQTNTAIIFINREPLAEDLQNGENVYYIGADPRASARLQAEIVMDLFGGNPSDLNEMDLNDDNIIQAIILKGQIGHQDAELRTEYVISEIEMNGYQLEVLEIRVANFDLETAETEMGLLLEEYGSSIEVVISNNDAMAIGAINTLVEEGYFVDTNSNGVIERETELWIPVIGIDGLPQSIDLIDRGYLYGTVINDSDSMAEVLVQLTKAILSGQDVNDIGYELTDGIYFWVDYQKYTKE
jgi:methyl-galactoside transport system substrate-binding protein